MKRGLYLRVLNKQLQVIFTKHTAAVIDVIERHLHGGNYSRRIPPTATGVDTKKPANVQLLFLHEMLNLKRRVD